MTVFPSAAPRCRNFTSSLLPSPNICCTWRKFNIWNQLNMQNPEQEDLMPTGIVKCVKTTWSHGGQLHSDMTIWVAQRTKNKKIWWTSENGPQLGGHLQNIFGTNKLISWLMVTRACKAQICGIWFGKQGMVTGRVGRCVCLT
jgi:hypothetical protein